MKQGTVYVNRKPILRRVGEEMLRLVSGVGRELVGLPPQARLVEIRKGQVVLCECPTCGTWHRVKSG